MKSTDGKMYKTDVTTKKQLFRIIQSISSPNAEPFKQWLAQVSSDRLDEAADFAMVLKKVKLLQLMEVQLLVMLEDNLKQELGKKLSAAKLLKSQSH